MSLLSRISNLFRTGRLEREIDEELAAHLAEAAEEGREAEESRRSLGSALHHREESRDARIVVWLDSLRADVVFGCRQLLKRKVTSAAAILSLALAIGACTSAFRLIDALLLRPLPVAHPERLYSLAREVFFDGKLQSYDDWAYPDLQLMRKAAQDQAVLIAVSYAQRTDLTYRSDAEMEKATVQYVSGLMFPTFGLRPELGRLFSGNDDLKPGGHPYAVLSYDYWTRRFGQDRTVIGKTFQMAGRLYEIVGVGPPRFTGTETGTVTEVFVPAMMHPGAVHDDWTWHRTLAQVKPGVVLEPLRAKLDATSKAFETERSKGFTDMSKKDIEAFLDQKVIIRRAAAGASTVQHDYERSLIALGVLVALVLLIACANVANLMTAQAASRAREMALRVSIGAGRMRLIQLVLVEGAMVALLAAALGSVFAWWSAPVVVGMINPPDNPVRLFLPADWRVLCFGVALTLAVTLLFGIMPALRASATKPASALKGGEDPHARRRLMHVLVAAQVAFCFLVLFMAGLFASTFQHLSHKPIGFNADRLLVVDTVTHQPVAPVFWDQVADHLREVPGVQKVAIAAWPLLGGNGWNGFVSINGAPPNSVLADFLAVSPGFTDTMRIHFVDGRDFLPGETWPGAAIINETFARQFFGNRNPIGQSIAKSGVPPCKVVGVVRDAPYRNVHEPISPVAFVPIHAVNEKGEPQGRSDAVFMVRTAISDPMALASILRREVPQARAEFRVSNIRTQAELVRSQTLRERLLATLGLFFAAVALMLAGIGLYGVLDYSVLQRRREIGIRMAIGAQAGSIARLVSAEMTAMVVAGAVAGVALGVGSVSYIEALLYQVKPTDWRELLSPLIIIIAGGAAASLPAIIRAVRVDPAVTLRME